MDESSSQPEESKDQPRFSQEQYDMLKRCSDEKDMTEWNEWRRNNDHIDIELEDKDFSKWYLQEVNLGTLPQHGRRTTEVFLSGANFDKADLRRANFQFAHVEGTRFHEAHMENAELMFAHLDNTFLLGVHLEGACLRCAELPGANVCNAHLIRSDFVDSHLEGSRFDNASLIGAKFQMAHASEATSFCYCKVDRETDFREVGIGIVQIDSQTKQLLEYNIRRMNWEAWYRYKNWQANEDERHIVTKKLMWFVRIFWEISDYGISTKRIMMTFLGLALFFAAIYSHLTYWFPPGAVSNLEVEPHLPIWHYFLLLVLRPIYFSVVTMTTLGFGDMYANAQSIWGHILLTIQVTLGYVLLGALVTRFAVLFTAGGPAGKFANEKEE